MTVVLEIGRVWTFESLAPRTIALDGAVAGPRVDADLMRFSFDHHAGCIRLVTSATCQQVFDAILLGLEPHDFTILLNHVDGDTTLSVWLLRCYEWWRSSAHLRNVRRLVQAVGAIDAHGPPYPAPHPDLGSYFHRWVMEPARGIRQLPGDETKVRAILDGCFERLDTWVQDDLHLHALQPGSFDAPKVIWFGTWALLDAGDWPSTRPTGGAAWAYERGFHRFVMCARIGDRRWRYTLCRRSDLVADFPLVEIYPALNVAEESSRKRPLGNGETWGGSSTVGGSPRDGSVLPPAIVTGLIGSVLARH